MCRYPESSINPKHPFPQRYPKINSSAHVKWLNCFLNLMTEFKFMNIFFYTKQMLNIISQVHGQLIKNVDTQKKKPESWMSKQRNFVIHEETNLRTGSMDQLGWPYLQRAKEAKTHTSHLIDIYCWHRKCVKPIFKPTPGPSAQQTNLLKRQTNE